MDMIVLVFALVLALAISGIAYLKYRLVKTPDRKNLELAIDAEVNKAMKGTSFPAIVVGVYKGDRTFIRGYGTVSKEIQQPPDAESVFQIGSITKVLTALLLQRLCDEGVVSMDATLAELLGASIPLSPSVKNVTLRQLVTHTSGFPRVPQALAEKISACAGMDHLMLNPYSHLEPQHIFDYLASAEGKRKAGVFDYSNYGMGLLGHILELVTGETYESLVKEKVLRPLDMSYTAITLSAEMKAKLVQGHTETGASTPMWTFAALHGAGAFSSTADDLMKFIKASLAEKGLAAELFQKMAQPQFKGNTGIGWMQPSIIDRSFGNRNVVWHNGMVGGYASYLAIDKKTGTGVVVLTNQASPAEMLGMMLMRQAQAQSWTSNTS